MYPEPAQRDTGPDRGRGERDIRSGAILYGSFARGDSDDESDVDVLVLVDLPAPELGRYRADVDHLCGGILFDYGVVLSVLEKDVATYEKYKAALPFYRNIDREGRRIA